MLMKCVLLHIHSHLNPALEPDHQPVIVDRDLLNQPRDQSLIVLVDLLLLSIQEVLEQAVELFALFGVGAGDAVIRITELRY